MEYQFNEIEKKWQKYWADNKTFKTESNTSKPKFYVLDMFPYPSGAGLHVGHPLGYIASDIFARYKRSKGFNVLHPMGYDSFGLPAEQYAIQTGQHPAITTEQNINRYREQLDAIGFSYDWDREVRTSDPAYYKWTQWIFIQIFHSWYNKETNKAEKIDSLIKEFSTNGNLQVKAACESSMSFSASQWNAMNEKNQQEVLLNYRLAYLAETTVNWCPVMGTVLANEEVKDGVSERGGYPVVKKLMKQWSMRITAYADRLLNDLETIDWSDAIKEVQRNWIGKSEGASIRFELSNNLPPDPSPKKRGVPEQIEGVEESKPDYYTTDGQMWNLLQDKAIHMRQNPTPAENALWQALRGNSTSNHFRRQHIIGRFIVDFVSLEKALVVEVDGDIHDHQKEDDEQRTAFLNERGFEVIRFRNEDILTNVDSVVKQISERLKNKLSPSPSPLERGEELPYNFNEIQSGQVLPFGEDLGGVEVFTTRPDTIFGVSFLTLAPEHELVERIVTPEQKEAVEKYIEEAKNRSERERMADVKRISGVFTGAYATHPFTGNPIPIWVGDYVLAGYGTGAVMAVPAHDTRDYAFAKHFKLPIIEVVSGGDISKEAYDAKDGILINSDFLNGLTVKEAVKKVIQKIEEKGIGKGKVNFRLRDAIFSRQRYWGEPIPVYYKDGLPYTLKETELPLTLPDIDAYMPTESGEPPLARAKNWNYKPLSNSPQRGKSTKQKGLPFGEDTGGVYPLETNTMPGWAGSSWYFLRYMDPKNDSIFASKEAMDYWEDVDLYMGGAEHGTGHLLYVRFWAKFLYDLGYIPKNEPAKKLINQGMIQGVSALTLALGTYKIKRIDDEIPIHVVFDVSIFVSKNKWLKAKANNDATFIKNAFSEYYPNEDLTNYEFSFSESEDRGIVMRSVPIEYVSNKDELDILQFIEWRKKWAGEGQRIHFVYEEDGTYICHREVEKMSKSKYNVVNPDDIGSKYGADTLRLYEMFLGPLELAKPWSTNGITGVYGFLRKLWRLYHDVDNTFIVSDEEPSKAEFKVLHKTIKKVQEDIERFSFNTSVSTFMICVNELTDLKCNKRAILEPLILIIAPYAPHIAEELWQLLGHEESVSKAIFPIFEEKYLVEDSFEYPISFNGKTRCKINISLSLSKEEIEKEVMSTEEVQKWLSGSAPKKIIVVPGKIVNIVI